MDQLLMHYTSAVHNTAWNKVYGHAVLSQQLSTPVAVTEAVDSSGHLGGAAGGTQCRADDLSKRLYGDICGKVASSILLPCLLDLCRALWNIMDSYKKVCDFHRSGNRKKYSLPDSARKSAVNKDDAEQDNNIVENRTI